MMTKVLGRLVLDAADTGASALERLRNRESAMAASAGCMALPRRRPMQTVQAQHVTLRAVSGARFVCGTTAQGLKGGRLSRGVPSFVTHRQDSIAQAQATGDGRRGPEEHPSLLWSEHHA